MKKHQITSRKIGHQFLKVFFKDNYFFQLDLFSAGVLAQLYGLKIFDLKI